MDRYPTPPPTSSPKHMSHDYHNDSHANTKSNDNGYGSIQAPRDNYASHGAQDSYYDSFATATQEYYNNGSGKHRPAQESYYQSTSDPVSPSKFNQAQNPYADYPARPNEPVRRSSSPIPHSNQVGTYSMTPQGMPQPVRRRSSPTPGRISSPFSHKPSSRPLSPYNASRPQPRPNLVNRFFRRIKSWARSLIMWARNNPIKMGIISFLPLLLGAGVWKTIKGVKHLYDHHISNKWKGKKDRPQLRDEWKKELKDDATKAKKAVRTWHEDIFGDFKGIAGSNSGPLDGILKIVHMLVNHYCKLSPSSVPRAASILLELYFLDVKRL